MDDTLKRRLRAIHSDKHSGANELARRAVSALQAWGRRNGAASERDFLEVAERLLETQPEMAPFIRLANEVALAVDAANPKRVLLQSCQAFELALRRGAARIAREFRSALAAGPKKTILTYSYSSTVLGALIRSKPKIRMAYCSEASPGLEGRALARKLAKAGIPVTLTTDLALPSFLHGADDEHPRPDAVVVGADQVRPGYFLNRYGTEILAARARQAGVPFWVLTDTIKFIPNDVLRTKRPHLEAFSQLWARAPKGVEPWLRLLGEAPLASHVRLLTERGWMTPKQVRREMNKIRISPRLRELLETRD